MKPLQTLGLILLGLVSSQISHAQNMEKGPQGKPPQAAILACGDIAEKTQCSFQGPKGLESGYCEHTPDKQYFACNPNRQNQQRASQPRNPNEEVNTSMVKTYPSHLAPNKN